MKEILDALPDDQRAAISLFYYEEMSVAEIAEAMGVSENTVRSRQRGCGERAHRTGRLRSRVLEQAGRHHGLL